MMSVQYYEGIGRRKESTARVRVMSGSGQFMVNDKTVEDYFTRTGRSAGMLAPLTAAGEESQPPGYHRGGAGWRCNRPDSGRPAGPGPCPAADEPGYSLEPAQGRLPEPRRAHVKERKKPGLKRARKAPTYTKR